MKVRAIADEALGNSEYLVELGDGAAAVDPRRDVDELQRVAAEHGTRITHVFETHLHADFVSGARELTGAEVVSATPLGFDHRLVGSGDELSLGDVSVRVIATPGHTPEHVAYLFDDGVQRALFSGGSLIAGGAARTDLSGADRIDELSRAQFASLRSLATLGDDTALYPTHGGGSFCSTGAAETASSTIGAERARNPLLALENEAAFVETLRAGFGSYPRYFAHLPALNRAGAQLVASLGAPRALTASDAERIVARGAWLIDARSVPDFARAHPAGAVSIALRPAFASWLGWVVPFGGSFILVVEPERVGEAVTLARRIGYDRLEGWLTFDAWMAAGLPVESLEQIPFEEARARVVDGAVLLDVRQRTEFDDGHLPRATHLELGDIIAGKSPEANDVVTYCGHGERSATAASLLARRGVRVSNLLGGAGAVPAGA